ncbi:NAD-binding protein [Dialister sp.]|uniref:NAD-binding protein n=1 Tax=Dialister sp. TaxID=1955814 RepID=UPI00406D51F2
MQNCDVAIVCIAEHLDTSILTTLNLVSLGIPRVIAKAATAEHGIILEKLGAEVFFLNGIWPSALQAALKIHIISI